MLWAGVEGCEKGGKRGAFAFADEEDAVVGLEGDDGGLGLRGFLGGGFGLGWFGERFEAEFLRLGFFGFAHCLMGTRGRD